MKLLFFLLLPIAFFSSCSKPADVAPALPPITLDRPTIDLHYDGSYQYNLSQGGSIVDPSTFTWTSSNPDAGSISATGKFTAKRIGQTVIKGLSKDNKNGVQSTITVIPYSTAWTEPITTFGVNKASIKLAEKRTLLSETSDGLVYYGENDKVRLVIYSFIADKFESVAVLPVNSSAIATESTIFLKERYTYLGGKDGAYIFSNDKKLRVGLTVDAQVGLFILYFETAAGGRLPAEVSLISRLAAFKSAYKL